jgi:hypothetical protein
MAWPFKNPASSRRIRVSDSKKTPPAGGSRTIKEDDIKTEAAVGRRSALGVMGTAAIAGAAGVTTGLQSRRALAATDGDSGATADPPNAGRGLPRGQASNVTDADPNNADPPNNGRGGEDQRRTGLTDADDGAAADPPANGRGPLRNTQTGVTDQDPSADPPNNGRNVARRSGK